MSDLRDALELPVNAAIKVAFTFKGFREEGEQRNLQLAWTATVSKLHPNGETREESFDYFTGSAWLTKKRGVDFNHVTNPSLTACTSIRGKMHGAESAMRNGAVAPKPPSAADLFYSLVSETDASSMGFEEWAESLGYDSDSRRALETYLACQNNTRRLARVIGYATLEGFKGLEH